MTKLEIMLPDAVSGAVETLSRQTGQSQEAIITRAVEAYVEGRVRWQADMERAMADVDCDIGHDGEAVLDWMERWGDEPGAPAPAAS